MVQVNWDNKGIFYEQYRDNKFYKLGEMDQFFWRTETSKIHTRGNRSFE